MSLWHDNQERLRSPWRFLLGVLVAIVANYIAIGVAVPLAHRNPILLEAIYRPLTLLLLFCGYALLLMSADQVHENFLAAMGLGRFTGWLRQAMSGIAIGSALVVVAVIWIVMFGDLRAVRFNLNPHTLWLALAELFILSTAAMGEELMFRGYPFQRLLEATGPLSPILKWLFPRYPAWRLEAVGPAIALVTMSFFFAVAHGGNPHATPMAMVNTFVVGALLCLAYLRTRALWMSWGIHFAWNTALGLVFGLPVSGLTDFAVIVKTRASGPRWVTGGAYGIEGSVVGTIVILLGFIPVILLTRRRPAPVEQVTSQYSGQPEVAQAGDWDGRSESDQPSARRIQE